MQQRRNENGFRVLHLRTSCAGGEEGLLAPDEESKARSTSNASEQPALCGFGGADDVFVPLAQHDAGVVRGHPRGPFVRGQNRVGPPSAEAAVSAAPSNDHAPALLDPCASPLIAGCEIPRREPADRKQIPSYIGCAVRSR